jgi:uncharacterized membrane protein
MCNKQLLLSTFIFIGLDSLYLSTLAAYFNKIVTQVQGTPIKYTTGKKIAMVILCYLCLLTALNYFILMPRKTVKEAFLLGFLIYGVYETTTYVLFNKWPLQAVLLDTFWGGILFGLTTYFTYAFSKGKGKGKG